MVSVKRFVQDEPELLKASVAFVKQFSSCPDPVLHAAGKARDLQSKMAWVLLGTALFQERSFTGLVQLMNALFEKYPDEKLWILPVPEEAEIQSVVERTFNSRNWPLFEHVAGIFWSVGSFVRHHPDLAAWAASRTPEEMWRDLGEIYFMGKGNPRPKACAAIYRIVAPAPLGLGVAYRRTNRMPNLPLTMGARRFLSILGPAREDGFSDLDPAEKQKLANEFFQAVYPENPYGVAHALQFFLEEGSEDFICRDKTDKCRLCPLYVHCNYAVRHE